MKITATLMMLLASLCGVALATGALAAASLRRLEFAVLTLLLFFASFQLSEAASGGVPSYAEPIKVYGPLGKAPDGRAITPFSKATADLNGDGLEDLVIAPWVGPLNQPGFALPILILLNDGAAGFIDGTASIISGPIPQFYVVRQIIIT